MKSKQKYNAKQIDYIGSVINTILMLMFCVVALENSLASKSDVLLPLLAYKYMSQSLQLLG